MKLGLFLTLAATLVLSLVSCGGPVYSIGELETYDLTVEFGEAESAEVDLGMEAGELTVVPGSGPLVSGSATTDVAEWRPKVSMKMSGGVARVGVKQPKGRSDGNATNQWMLALSKDLPLDLNVGIGAGEARLDLRSLQLRKLNVGIGAGEVSIDLRGDWKRSFKVDVGGGAGETTVLLPRGVGIRAEVTKGLGSSNVKGLNKVDGVFVNDLAETADVVIELDVSVGVGAVNLEVK